ncbi:hypothetical protein N8261_04945 [Flavobacteriaceae bacterium]|nr:hypothetical protein [Flavobacteriaceae bacterium]
MSFPYSYYHGTILADQNDIYVTEVDNLVVMKMNQNTNLKFLESFAPFPDISCIVVGGGGAGGGKGSGNLNTAGGGGGGAAAAIVNISGDFILNYGKTNSINDGSYILQTVIGTGAPYGGTSTSSQLGNIITCGGGDSALQGGGGGQPAGGTFTNIQALPSYLGGDGGRGGQSNNSSIHPSQVPLVDSPYAGQPGQLAIDLLGSNLDLPTDISNILYSGCGAGGGGTRTQPLTSAGSGHAGGGNTNQAGQYVPYGMYAAGMASGIGRGYASTVFGGGGSGCNGITSTGSTEIGGVGADGTIILYFEALTVTVSGDYYSYYDVPQSTSFTISPINPIDFGTRDISSLSLIGDPSGNFTIDNSGIIISNISPTFVDLSYTIQVEYTYTNKPTEDSNNIEIRIINPVYQATYDVPYQTYFTLLPLDLQAYTDISFTNTTPLPHMIMDTSQNIGAIVYYESALPPYSFALSGTYHCSVSVIQVNNCTWTQDIEIDISSVPVYDLSYIIAQNATFTINPLYAINEGIISFPTGKGQYFQIDSGGKIKNTDLFSPPLTDKFIGEIHVDISNTNYKWYKPIVMNIDLFYLDSYTNIDIDIDTIIPEYTLSSIYTYSLTSDPIFTINSSSGVISNISLEKRPSVYNLSVTLNEPNNKVEWIKEIELIIVITGCLWNSDLSAQTDIWSRFSGDCIDLSGAFLTPGVPMTYDDLSEKRKAVIFQYKNNSAGFSKKQHFSRLARGLGKQGKQTYATQNDNYVNPNNKGLKLNNFTLECPGAIKNSGLTTQNDTPGPVRTITNYPNVPLTNYIVQRTYRGGSEKWPQYGPNTGQARNPKFARNTGTKPGYNS